MTAPSNPTTSPPAVAPALGELFELSLAALVNAPGVFDRLSLRPAPMPASSFLMALSWGAAYFTLNLVRIAVANPAALAIYPAWQIGAIAFFGFGAWAALFLLGASFLYGIGRTLGTAGDFDRALVVAALALGVAPVQALCGWLPALWFLPTVLSAWIVACGLHALFKADAWATRGLCALLAAAALGLQYAASLAVDRYPGFSQISASQTGPSASQILDLQEQLKQVQTLAEGAPSSATPAASSLDLLRAPDQQASAPTPLTQEEQLRKLEQASVQGDALNKSVIKMLDSLTPILSNPALTAKMAPQQKADFNELNTLIADMKARLASKASITNQEQQRQMMRIQELMMRLMSHSMSMPKASPAAAPEAKR